MTKAIVVACICGVLAGCGDGKSTARTERGRLQFVYDLDVDKAIDDKTSDLQRDLEAALADQKLAARVTVSPTGTLTVRPGDDASKQAIAALVAATYGETVELRDCPDPHELCIAIAAGYARTVKKAALASAVETIRQRITATDATVAAKADQIVVELPATDDNRAEIRSLIARTGKLELKVVDEGSDYMKRLFAHVKEAAATADEIGADIDQWHSEGGQTRIDYYLTARDREATVSAARAQQLGCVAGRIDNGQVRCTVSGRAVLESYLAELAAKDPSFQLPADRQIGYERVEPAPDARDRRTWWRTYYLERAVRLTGASIANAEPSFDPNTHRPIVLLDLDRLGTRTFADLTSQIVGRKLATLLDDRITSAPIINEPIRGGRIAITMGGSDASRQEAERDELVRVLKSGSLPSPLRLSTQSTVP